MDPNDFSDPAIEDALDDVFDPFARRTPPPGPLPPQIRPDVTPTSKRSGDGKRRGKKSKAGLVAAAAGAAAVLVAGLTAMTVMVSGLPWLSDDDQHAASDIDPVVPEVPVVTASGPVLAERVLDQVAATELPNLSSWEVSPVSETIAATSFGFGCDPQTGFAPVVSRSRSYTDASDSVALAVDAYPAGGGAVALEEMRAAAGACTDAYIDPVPTPVADLGVEVERISSDRVSALVWRRGDVVVTASVTRDGRSGDPGAHSHDFEVLDDTLAQALAPVCVNEASTVKDATRSPYLDRGSFKGLMETEDVSTPPVEELSAEDRTKFPVADIPAPTLDVPEVGDLPVAPVPAPTVGPKRLPAPAASPRPPTAPDEPQGSTTIRFPARDDDGPGCGWAFTAQEVPQFDEVAASVERDAAFTAAQEDLVEQWRTWQKAKMRYYRAHDTYTGEVKTYRAYARQVRKAREAWAVVEAARDTYYDALTVYEAAVEVRDTFLAERAAAKQAYEANRAACAARPKPSPTASPKPRPKAEPEPVCPAVRPEILDEPVPNAPVSPTPQPQAQLPAAPR